MDGFIAFMTIFVGIPGLFFWGVFALGKKFGPAHMARQRDQQIETSMRLGLRDAEAYERIAQQIRDERRI
jgi:hypothetical protein